MKLIDNYPVMSDLECSLSREDIFFSQNITNNVFLILYNSQIRRLNGTLLNHMRWSINEIL